MIARLQKCAGVHRNTSRPRTIAPGCAQLPAAALPLSTAHVPAKPPTTIFNTVRGLSQTVYTPTYVIAPATDQKDNAGLKGRAAREGMTIIASATNGTQPFRVMEPFTSGRRRVRR